MSSRRCATLQTTEAILNRFVTELSRSPEEGETYTPLKVAAKFSRRKLTDLNQVLNAAKLPAGVVIYDGASYQRGRPPTRISRVAVVVRVPTKINPETTAQAAREQLDACRDRLDEMTFGNAIAYAQSDGVTEASDGSINYFIAFEIWDH